MAVVIFNLFLAAAISFTIAFLHKWTRTGLSYSQSLFATLVMLGVITAVIITVVQNNVFGALGLLGAFTFIRFRTIIKETRDIAFVFFALAEGVASGLGHYAVAIVSTIFISFIVYLIFKYNLGSASGKKLILLLTANAPIGEDLLNTRLSEKNITVTMISGKKNDSLHEYVFYVYGEKLADGLDGALNELTRSLQITNYEIISGRESIEY